MRNPIAWLALFFALAGTSVAAVRGFRDGSLTNRDVHRRTLTGPDLAPGALVGRPGPTGPAGAQGPAGAASTPGAPASVFDRQDALVAADGTIVSGTAGALRVTHPQAGVYCLSEVDGAYVQAFPTSAGALASAARLTGAKGACGADDEAGVRTFSAAGEPVDAGFRVSIS